ncbi:hypothetical protein ACKI10_43410 [Streptomyces galilaeus]|uniref:Uncharacterized protein n=1 Tax=Streptomyces galilaeus TaxID=33899 RepID=A0ABW9IYI4_STRGJ
MTLWLAGMRTTADRLYETDLIGRTVFAATRSISQTIPTGAEVAANAISWDVIDLDVLGGWTAGQPTRYTITRSGWWVLKGSVAFNSSTAGTYRDCCWFINGGLPTGGRSRALVSTAIAAVSLTVPARSRPMLLAVGDYVQLVPSHNVGADLGTATGSLRPDVSLTYAGPA